MNCVELEATSQPSFQAVLKISNGGAFKSKGRGQNLNFGGKYFLAKDKNRQKGLL